MSDQRPYLVFVSPGEVVIDVNVRELAQLTPAFVDDIRDRGVEQPPVGYLDGDDRVHVVIGQRRTLAARQVELPEIPVLIKPRETAESEAAAERARIIRQVAENEHRQQLTAGEQYSAQATLFNLDMTADEVAKALHMKRDRVRLAYKLHREKPATVTELHEHHEVTLDQVAAIAEFEEHADLRASLYESAEAEPSMFAHRVAAARDEVVKRAQLAAAVAELEVEGIPYLLEDDLPEEYEWDQLASLDEVYLADVPSFETVSVERAAEQGGLVARLYWGQEWESGVGWVTCWHRDYWIELPRQHGFLDESEMAAADEAESATSAESVERERLAAEERERKSQLARSWELADRVRQDWIRDVLLNDRRKLPAGAGMVILDGMLKGGGVLPRFSFYSDSTMVGAKLLGLTGDAANLPNLNGWVPDKEHKRYSVLRDLAKNIGHERVLLALTLGQTESNLTRTREETLAPYLQLLESWGYGFSDAEAGLVREWHEQQAASETE